MTLCFIICSGNLFRNCTKPNMDATHMLKQNSIISAAWPLSLPHIISTTVHVHIIFTDYGIQKLVLCTTTQKMVPMPTKVLNTIIQKKGPYNSSLKKLVLCTTTQKMFPNHQSTPHNNTKKGETI